MLIALLTTAVLTAAVGTPAAEPALLHLAACDGQRVEYLGHLDADHDFVALHPVGGSQRDLPAREEVAALVAELAAQEWTVVAPGAEHAGSVEGSALAAPFGVGVWNAAYQVTGTGLPEALDEFTLVLGPCEVPGQVYLSAPRTPTRSRRPGTGEAEATVASLVHRVPDAELVDHDVGVFSGSLEVVADYRKELAGEVFTTRRWVVDGVVRGDVAVGWYRGEVPPIPPRTWIELAYRVHLGVMPFESTEKSYNRGFVVMVRRHDGVQVVAVLTEGRGC